MLYHYTGAPVENQVERMELSKYIKHKHYHYQATATTDIVWLREVHFVMVLWYGYV